MVQKEKPKTLFKQRKNVHSNQPAACFSTKRVCAADRFLLNATSYDQTYFKFVGHSVKIAASLLKIKSGTPDRTAKLVNIVLNSIASAFAFEKKRISKCVALILFKCNP